MVGSPERNQRFSTTMFFQLIFLVVRSGKPSSIGITEFTLKVEMVSTPVRFGRRVPVSSTRRTVSR